MESIQPGQVRSKRKVNPQSSTRTQIQSHETKPTTQPALLVQKKRSALEKPKVICYCVNIHDYNKRKNILKNNKSQQKNNNEIIIDCTAPNLFGVV